MLPEPGGAGRAQALRPRALCNPRGSISKVVPGKTPSANPALWLGTGLGAGGQGKAVSLPGSPPPHTPRCLFPSLQPPAFRGPGPENPLWKKARCRGDAGYGARESGAETWRLRQRAFAGGRRGLPPRCVLTLLLTHSQSLGLGAWLSHTAGRRPWKAEGEKEQEDVALAAVTLEMNTCVDS